MARSKVLLLALASAVGIVVIPAILPAGPTGGLDASKFLAGGQFAIAAGVIFLGGLLTSMTPCVWPLIPITVGVFGARQAESRARAVVLTTAYVVGMGAVFATLGVVAAMAGKAFGTSLGNAWVAAGLAVFMIALAASMFGAFELALPSGLATKLNNVGGGGLIGAFLMGAVSGFLAAPCTGPVLSGVLAFVSRTQDPALGASLLFIYALGIGVPFFLIGVFLVRLPKGGVWMEWVKSVFGVALVALAVAYLRDALPAFRNLITAVVVPLGAKPVVAAASVLALVGVFMGAIHLSFKETVAQAAAKAVGVLAVVVALTIRTSPMPDVTAGADSMQWAINFRAETAGTADPFNALLDKAKASCKPVMIDFFAEWCAACKELDKHTYTSPKVVAETGRFIAIKVDGTNDHEVLDKLYERFGVQGLPTVAFVDARGAVLQNPKVTGFLPPEEFLAEMKKVPSEQCTP
jgi:thiol:disulfide interchange protein DsbD